MVSINLFLVFLLSKQISAQTLFEQTSENISIKDTDTIYIFGEQESLHDDLPGSIHRIDEKELNIFKNSDVHRVLKNIPGVYLQEEDALGLRPNIGLRGVHPHRSRKITLLEDGVLIAPAPYSAPAAYYFPNMHRINSVEVYKGPSSVRYGPNSIGGAVNLLTRPLPRKGNLFEIDLAQGVSSYGNQKLHLTMGRGDRKFSWMVDATRLSSDGIKTLPDNNPTGFTKNDIMLKLGWPLYRHNFDLKISYANEQSHETYLGLTESDFTSSPYSRYAASANDLMDWNHYQVELRHRYNFSNLVLSSGIYHHRFDRKWSKISGFRDGTTIKEVIDSEGSFFHQSYLNMLKGELNSFAGDETDLLIMGNNDRSYFGQGIFVDGDYLIDTDSISHNLRFGLRTHRDQIKLNHSEDFYSMLNGSLDRSNLATESSLQNRNLSWANTVYLEDEVSFVDGKLKLTMGTRVEEVNSTSTRQDLSQLEKSDIHIVPGMGIYGKITKNLGLLAGVGRGVVLPGPGEDSGIGPEESINYELGFRYDGYFNWEAIGFLNDYQNIKGTCSFSSGCDAANLNREFDGGKAIVYGLESKLYHNFRHGKLIFPVQLNYTVTTAKFSEDSATTNPQWGSGLRSEIIRNGDPLPYIPDHH
ncbi:MAG: TonB-dependent receptor, partial [Halobacteriovoraceae bacterium]|nr:TonB-dependent receptor [Halobacteriovoraceae bacterium]